MVQPSIVNAQFSSFHMGLTVGLFFFWTNGTAMRAALDYHSLSGNFLFFKNLTTFGSLVYIPVIFILSPSPLSLCLLLKHFVSA